ncbi:MAG TPA: prolipoprotein diacylglyceryl transferase family protein [Candidatus Binatia bacterium]|nr:prolipoprotein diacylglyceryl transferase family protein [Candidatus Binatia bacterium]
MKWQKIVYGAVFLVVLPALLCVWASAARIPLPVYGSIPIGIAFACAGLTLMFAAMFELWRFGGGLPMNAFPPPAMVSRGTFQLLSHPIYTGFVAVCLGVSMVARSASGLWLITPAVALGCVALVVGYEHPDLLARFGRTLPVLPANDDAAPSTIERLRFILHVIVPWTVVFEFTSHLSLRGLYFGLPFEKRLPVLLWTAPFYESTYVMVALAPWLARTRKDLRQFTLSAWLAMLVVFPIYWFLPSTAPRPPLPPGGWISELLRFERTTYPPVAALPSFHVLWSILVARMFRRRWLGWAYSLTVAVSCITTGMHYVADVLAAFAITPLILNPQEVWETQRRLAERLANSWREWRVGKIRIISHSMFAGAAAFVQTSIVFAAAGRGHEWEVLVVSIAGLVGAGIWAQLVEGSSRLRRPFGFYGGLLGVGIACLFFGDRWTLLAANCLAAPWMQAIGRLRCLVNGCCHGRPTTSEIGIRVAHPCSRVARIAELAGVPIHVTQLYSILTNVFLGLLVMRLWISGCPMALICGIYGIGNGLARFAEEAYRGEPQTPEVFGLRLYQWLAIATVFLGAALTTFDSPPPPAMVFTPYQFGLAAAFALLAGAALGVDFPESDSAFARLT